MSFTCIPVQIEPNESLLRKKLLVLLLWEFGHLSSPSRSCLGRLILICSRWGALWAKLPICIPGRNTMWLWCIILFIFAGFYLIIFCKGVLHLGSWGILVCKFFSYNVFNWFRVQKWFLPFVFWKNLYRTGIIFPWNIWFNFPRKPYGPQFSLCEEFYLHFYHRSRVIYFLLSFCNLCLSSDLTIYLYQDFYWHIIIHNIIYTHALIVCRICTISSSIPDISKLCLLSVFLDWPG